jgi:hypothetical protein
MKFGKDLPTPAQMRALSAKLSEGLDDELRNAVARGDYSRAQWLVGYHQCAQDLKDGADAVEEEVREAGSRPA